jgi:Tfp pilus assembly protein PilF
MNAEHFTEIPRDSAGEIDEAIAPSDPWKWIAPGVLILAVALAYSNSLHGEFIFDDLASIPQNPHIRQLSPLGEVLCPPVADGRTVQGRPMLSFSLAINYALGGLAVEGYHLFNVVVHVLAVLTLYGLVRQTLKLPNWPQKVRNLATPLSLAVALIWGVHPLLTSAVTYTIQRAESMASLFYLLTLYASVRAARSRVPVAWYVLGVVWCLLGMATKELMATAPIVVLLYDRVFLFPDVGAMFRRRWGFYAGLASTWLLLLALMSSNQGRGNTVGFSAGISSSEYFATQFGAIVHYLRLVFVPYPLVLDYGVKVARHSAEVLPFFLIVAALAAGTLAAFRFRPWIGFLGASFFIVLAPSSSIVPIVTQTVAEHRMYLASAAVIALAIISAAILWQQQARFVERSRLQWAPALTVAAMALVLGALTWQRNHDYRTAASIWRDTMVKQPDNPRPHGAMVDLLYAAGDYEAALAEAEICVAMDPNRPDYRYNRATLYLELGRLPDALAEFTETLKLRPMNPAAWHNRALVHQDLGMHAEALEDFKAALELDPNLAVSYKYRAKSWEALHRPAEAAQDRRIYEVLTGQSP